MKSINLFVKVIAWNPWQRHEEQESSYKLPVLQSWYQMQMMEPLFLDRLSPMQDPVNTLVPKGEEKDAFIFLLSLFYLMNLWSKNK